MDDDFIQVSSLAVFPRSCWHLAIMDHVRGVQKNDPSIMHHPVITFGSIGLHLDIETNRYYLQGSPSNEIAPRLPTNLIYQVSQATRVVLPMALSWFVLRDRKMLQFIVENRNPGATGMVEIKMWKGDNPSQFGICYSD